jgi:hypothetical protein
MAGAGVLVAGSTGMACSVLVQHRAGVSDRRRLVPRELRRQAFGISRLLYQKPWWITRSGQEKDRTSRQKTPRKGKRQHELPDRAHR